MATNNKDTIYVDIDDEITTIIDKVRSSEAKIIALVLPKRATVFQSVVNMKLLKRSAEAAKKHIVLITTESSLMPLAGAVGVHVAATLQSKPEIPAAAHAAVDGDEVVDEGEMSEGYTADNAGDRSIGDLAGGSITAPTPTGVDAVETLKLPDNDAREDNEDSGDTAATEPKAPGAKHLKVPNFNKFRARLFIATLAIVLIVFGLYIGLSVLPKATVAITTNASSVNVGITPTLDTSAQVLDMTKLVVPAKIEQQQKTTSQQVATTGQKNNGTAATGSITLAAQECAPNLGQPTTVPAGTGISSSGLTFITQGSTQFQAVGTGHGSCVTYQATGPTNIAAQNPGAKYNVSSATFTVAGRSDVSGNGSTTGGSDNIIQIVAQADIDSAKQKLSTQDTASVKTSLEQTLQQDGLYPIPATFNAGTPVITSSSNVGDQASNVTVTQAVTYTMFGAKKSDLQTLLKNNVDGQINTNNQGILDDGLGSANVGLIGSSGSAAQISIQTTATVGPDINTANVKKQVAGKKAGDAKTILENISGVTNVDVQLSPFWVGSIPKNTNKITVTISKAKQNSHGSG